MKDLKLVICDIDSTLVDSKRNLMPTTRETIEKLHENGVYFGIASGRPLDELQRYAKIWGLSFEFDFVIGMNGSELWDNIHQKEYSYFKLKKEWIKEIIEFMRPFKSNYFIYYHDKLLAKGIDDMMIKSAHTSDKEIVVAKSDADFYQEENAKIMFRVTEDIMPEIEAYVEAHPNENYNGFKTQTILMEFADKRINKSYALKKICEMNDFELENVAAFGDTTNDNEMLEVSGLGVCMINGSDDTKAVADDITLKSNNEDGVGDYLRTHFLDKLQ